MAYIQKMNAPQNRIIPFHIVNYSGGLNNRSHLTKDNESSNLLNMTFYDDVVLEKRKGTTTYDNTVLTEPVTFVEEYQPYNQANQMIRAGKSTMKIDKPSGVVNVSVAGDVDGINHEGKFYFVDGDKIRVYGVFPQASDTYTSVVGTATSDYVVMEVVNPGTFTPLDTSHKKGKTVINYTTKKVWYEPCQNELNDPYKGVNTIPDNPKFIKAFKGRMYIGGSAQDDDNIYLSDIANPYYYPVALPLQVPPNADFVTGLAIYDDSIIVGRKRDIHVITGVTNNPELGLEMYELKKLNTHTGFLNNKTVNVAHNYLFFMGYDGNAYALGNSRTEFKQLATTLLNQTIDFEGNPFGFDKSDMTEACAHFFDNVWYISIKGYVFCYHYKIRAWVVFNGLNIRTFYDKDYTLLWGNEAGQTCLFTDNYLDQGQPYLSYWESGALDFGDPSTFKQYRDVFLLSHSFTGYESDIRVGFQLDFNDIQGQINIPNEVARFGTARFGDRYSAKAMNTSLPFTIGRRARNIKIRLANGYTVIGTVADVASLPTVGLNDEDTYFVTATSQYATWDDYNRTWVYNTASGLNQPMRVYQINGEYELRGKR